MSNPVSRLQQLSTEDPDLALILDVYGEIDRVYREALKAMGDTTETIPDVMNSSEVTVSFHPSASTSDYRAD